ncbi:endolytic transglycosylase MltG [Radiobacillus sp. PE A8.2]|uniref:endolytic transglycosylase MltG n=1 Tax=Radiobacillus sp. PE A8.2 TaxID=3380349 RepID=UPI00388E3695
MTTSGKKEDKKNQVNPKYIKGEEAGLVRKIVMITLTCITLIIGAGAYWGYSYIKTALEPVDATDDTTTKVEIPLGSSTSQIAAILEENNIINNAKIFRYYIKFNNVTQFQAGEYDFSPSMTLDEVINKLQTGKVMKEAVLTVTIPEGKTIDQIAEIYAQNAGIDKEEFIETVNDPAYIEQLMNKYPAILTDEILQEDIRTPLEGYLFAATYDFYEEEPSVKTIVTAMLDKTESVLTNYLSTILDKDFYGEKMTVHEAITMASLVENEARTEEDRKQISGVFYNRLADGMKLQTDPTVLYALGKHKDRVLFDDLEVHSPYNTYVVTGLPIGPISNFSESSLQSVVEPIESDYLYFVAASDGSIYYAKTFDEHRQNIETHQVRGDGE